MYHLKIELSTKLEIAIILKRGSFLKKTLLINIKICPSIDESNILDFDLLIIDVFGLFTRLDYQKLQQKKHAIFIRIFF